MQTHSPYDSHCMSEMAPVDANSNVYVRNLAPSVDDAWLRSTFGRFGLITSAKVMTTFAKKSKGYGFVQFTNARSAQLAVSSLSGLTFDGCVMEVKYADREKDRGQVNQPSNNVYVSNLPMNYGVTETGNLFCQCGNINSMVILTNPVTGVSRGIALVRFYSIDCATYAIQTFNGVVLEGHDRPLEVKYAENQEEKSTRRLTSTRAGRKGQKKNVDKQDAVQETMPPAADEEFAKESFTNVLYVTSPGLGDKISELDLYRVFSPFGRVNAVTLVSSNEVPMVVEGCSKCAIVEYQTADDARAACTEVDNSKLRGCALYVACAKDGSESMMARTLR
eukprot:NODE_4279_length_1087_cov_123.566390_g4080_i0.p1 GENE.NODE_4279_length_1087_cov_123.566390_g4080_i0~~NODE_4279_length_1087_cov_123.566390_g4080_i0.p1  ORF type:complete len:335 (+),score=61.66 NODE_4279_length_1087_cov_123.566390_g4080_i0:79-1083(+)